MNESSATPETASETGVPPVIEGKGSSWRWLWALPVVLVAVILGLLFSYNPAHHSFYPFCMFYRVTGWQCPGCGGLRATHHLLHGEVWTAFRFNPLVVLAVPLLLWWAVRRIKRGSAAKRFSARVQVRWGWMILAGLIVFWIVRNLPFEIFRLPSE